jgi:hypothetical protein
MMKAIFKATPCYDDACKPVILVDHAANTFAQFHSSVFGAPFHCSGLDPEYHHGWSFV